MKILIILKERLKVYSLHPLSMDTRKNLVNELNFERSHLIQNKNFYEVLQKIITKCNNIHI